jgi:hypothetical protein
MQITTVRAEHSYAYNPASSSTANTSLKTLPKFGSQFNAVKKSSWKIRLIPGIVPIYDRKLPSPGFEAMKPGSILLM